MDECVCSCPGVSSRLSLLSDWEFHSHERADVDECSVFQTRHWKQVSCFFFSKFLILRPMGSDLLWPVKEVPVIIAAPRSSSQDLIGFRLLQKKKREKKNSFQSRSESFCRPTLFSPPFGRVAFESSVIKFLNWSINHQKLGGGAGGEERRAFSDHILGLHPKHGSEIKNTLVGIKQI